MLIILEGSDKGIFPIVDWGVPMLRTQFSAGGSGQVMPIFFAGKPEDFKISNINGTRLGINCEGPIPIVGGGFMSSSPNQIEATYGLYIRVGKSWSVKSVSLNQPIQINIGTTTVIK